MTRRYPTTVAALLLAVTACSGSDEPSSATGEAPDDTTAPTDAPAPTAGATVDEEESEASSEDSGSEPTPPSSTQAAPTTAPAPTTTTEPPPRPVTISQTAIDADLDIRAIKNANDLITLPGDPITAVVVGDLAGTRGAPPHAAAWWSTNGRTWEELRLDEDGAAESRAYGVAGNGELVAVAGVVAIDGEHRAAVWRSSDRGGTFGTPEFPIDEPSLGAHATFVGSDPLVVSWRVADDGRRLVASRVAADGWSNVELPEYGRVPLVSGIATLDQIVVVTGRVEVAGRVTGAVWRSPDGGATFERVDDPAIAASSRIGSPELGGDGFIATAARPDNGATVLVTSADGVAWREIGLSATSAGGRSTDGTNGGSEALAVLGDGYAVGFINQLAAVAIVGDNGNGSFELAPYSRNDRFSRPIPFQLSNGLHVLGHGQTSFVVAELQGETWTITGQPGPSASGPSASTLDLWETSTGLVAEAASWPLVEPDGGGIRWSPVNTFHQLENGSWSEQSDFPQATALVTDGEADLAFVFSDDPGDNDLAGPNSGTSISIRTDGAWSTPELILSGPGGDYLYDAVATDFGFAAVGTRYLRDANGQNTSSVVVMESVDGSWNEATVVSDLGDRAELDHVDVADDGSIVATGWVFESAVWRPLILRRADDGWSRVVLPTEDDSAEIREVIATAEGIELITNEQDSWFRYRPQPDGGYAASPIQLPNPATDFPTAIVAVDDRLIVIGTKAIVGLSRIAVWELTDDGTARELTVDAAPTAVEIQVDAAEVLGGTIYVSGVLNEQHVVWDLDLGDQ